MYFRFSPRRPSRYARRGSTPTLLSAPRPSLIACSRPMCVAQPAVVLTTCPWIPLLRAELRLFTGGISVDTPQHGPHTLPFRVHLAAVGAFQLHHPTKPGVLFLRQKPDLHGYGPTAFLPEAVGGTEAVDMSDPPMRILSLALIIPPRSHLARALEIVWPFWQRLCADCGVPLDELAAPPAEFVSPLEVMGRAEAAGM